MTGRRAAWRSRWREEDGQTFTEYTMILGLLTSIIIILTGLIVPSVSATILGMIRGMALYLTSEPP